MKGEWTEQYNEGFKAGKEECAKTHFKPDWKIKAKDLKEGMEESYKAGQEEERKRIGKWLEEPCGDVTHWNKVTIELFNPKRRYCDKCIEALKRGESPEGVKPCQDRKRERR